MLRANNLNRYFMGTLTLIFFIHSFPLTLTAIETTSYTKNTAPEITTPALAQQNQTNAQSNSQIPSGSLATNESKALTTSSTKTINALSIPSNYTAPGTPQGLEISLQRQGMTMVFQSRVANFENYFNPPAQIEFVVKRKSTGSEVARVRTELKKPWAGGTYQSPNISGLVYDAVYEVSARLFTGNDILSGESARYTIRTGLRGEDYSVDPIQNLGDLNDPQIKPTVSSNSVTLDINLRKFSKPEFYEDPQLRVTLQQFDHLTGKYTGSPIVLEKTVTSKGVFNFNFANLKAETEYLYKVELVHEERVISGPYLARIATTKNTSGGNPPTKPTGGNPTNPTGGNPTTPPSTGATKISLSNLSSGQKLESNVYPIKGSFQAGSPVASVKAYYREVGSGGSLILFGTQSFGSRVYSGNFTLNLDTRSSTFKDGKKYELLFIAAGATGAQVGSTILQVEISKKSTTPAPTSTQNVTIQASAKLSGSSYQITGTLKASSRALKRANYYLWINNVRTFIGQQTSSSTTSKILTINTKVATSLIKKGAQYKFEVETVDSSNIKTVSTSLVSFP